MAHHWSPQKTMRVNNTDCTLIQTSQLGQKLFGWECMDLLAFKLMSVFRSTKNLTDKGTEWTVQSVYKEVLMNCNILADKQMSQYI